MGIDAENDQGEVLPEENHEELEVEVSREAVESDRDSEKEQEEQAENQEVTQPQITQEQLNSVIQRKTRKAKQQVEQSESKNALLEEKVKLLELSLEQERGNKKSAEPNPDNYEGGEWDEKYKQDVNKYQHEQLKKTVLETVRSEQNAIERERVEREKQDQIRLKQEMHYRKALELGNDDYVQNEDRAIDVLGEDAVNHIIQNYDDSHVLLNYLGHPANASKASSISSLVKGNAIKAIDAITRLSVELSVKPEVKESAPNPVDPLKGGNAGEQMPAWMKGAKFE
jgi:hypothetical protein